MLKKTKSRRPWIIISTRNSMINNEGVSNAELGLGRTGATHALVPFMATSFLV